MHGNDIHALPDPLRPSVVNITSDEDEVTFSHVSQSQLAWKDIKNGIMSWRIWFMLAYQDIKLRYRRSVIGPFWLTLSMAISVYSMGFLYSRLFHMELENYFPFLVSGMLVWSLISSLLTEYTEGLLSAEGLIKQIKLPYTLHIHRIAARNLIIFFHNILVLVPIMIIYHKTSKINFYTFMLIPGLVVLYFNSFTYGMVISIIVARFRDMSQIIKSLIQIIFFITPIMWKPESLSGHARNWIVLNPFYSFVQMIREPLLGNVPTLSDLYIVTGTTIIGLLISYKLFKQYRSRIVYWL